MTDHASPAEHVGIIRRLMTIVYDSFLVFACCLLTGGVVVASKIAMTDEAEIEAMRSNGERAISGPIESGILFAVCLATVFFFYAYFWRKTGQTLAMQAWRSKIVDINSGNKPSWYQCVIRFVVGFFAFALGGMGFLWMLVDRDKLTWQDRASGTKLILLPKRNK
jgi:uncharacterized RDD family membrane protein YckC